MIPLATQADLDVVAKPRPALAIAVPVGQGLTLHIPPAVTTVRKLLASQACVGAPVDPYAALAEQVRDSLASAERGEGPGPVDGDLIRLAVLAIKAGYRVEDGDLDAAPWFTTEILQKICFAAWGITTQKKTEPDDEPSQLHA
jgi:hypothetical protein